ncbi:MAG: hypothetical protein EXS31_16330 [Pedosphaera sp.]|nr:hypothetical protein [Pedosphaera sp.]
MSSENDSTGVFGGFAKWVAEKPLRLIPLFLLVIVLVASLAAPCGRRTPPSAVAIAAEAYQESSTSMSGNPVTSPITYRIIVTVTNTGWRPIVFDTIQAFFNSDNSGQPLVLTRHPHDETKGDNTDVDAKNLNTAAIAPGAGERFVFTGADTAKLNPDGWNGEVEFFFRLNRGSTPAVGTYAFQRPETKDVLQYELSLPDARPGKPLTPRFVTNP